MKFLADESQEKYIQIVINNVVGSLLHCFSIGPKGIHHLKLLYFISLLGRTVIRTDEVD